MSKKILSILVFSLVLFSFSTSTADAKKVIPRSASSAKPATTTSGKPTQGIITKVRFRSDRRAIVATFTNLSVAKNVSYTLTYDAGGTTQGAGGSILPGTSEPVIRELLFGSCSHGVCRYDAGIANAKLIVVTTLNNGRKVSKTFRLKV